MTNPKQDPFIVGTMRLGSWGSNLNTLQLESFIAGCMELGLNTFDHADIYGDYTTEAAFGEVLKQQPAWRDDMQLITKTGIRKVSANRPDHRLKSYDSSREHIIASVDQSLRNFHTDHIDMLLIHRPDYLMDVEEVAEIFTELRSAGKVLHFGVSNFSQAQCKLLHGIFPLQAHQIEVSISTRHALDDGTLSQCMQLGISPQAWSPLGGGILFQDTDDERTLAIRHCAKRIGQERGYDMDQVLLAWLRRHPAGIIPVLGTSRLERVQKAHASLNLTLSREEWYMLLEAATGQRVA